MQRRRFRNLAELVHSIGSLPLTRILLNAPCGLALESDVVWLIAQERQFAELIDGTLVEKAMGSFEDLIASVLLARLHAFVEPRRLGVVVGGGCIIRVAPEQLRLPDVSYISFSRIPDRVALTESIWDLAPDLAVEIISKGNTRDEMARKLHEFFAAGVRLIWFIYPKSRTAEVFKNNSIEPARILEASESLDGEDVLPGFNVVINELFKNIDQV